MAEIDKRVSAMNTVSSVSANDLALATIVDSGETSGYSSRKITEGNKAQSYLNTFEFPLLLTKTTNKSIIGAINEIGFKELTGTLEAGETELTISDASILTSSTIDIFTDVYGISPEDVEVETGSITLTFEERESDLSVKVRVY